MRRIIITVFLCVSAIVFNVGCKKIDNSELETSDFRVVANIRRLGKPVDNPTNSSLCLNAGSAEKTLSSLRSVSDRLYYMDFTTDLRFDKLIQGGYKEHEAYNSAMDSLWFTEEGWEKPFDEEHPYEQACSGFICFNENGEVLFGRNFDGAGGPLCLLFNSGNGYRHIQFTAPNYNSALYNGYARGDFINGDGILSDGRTSLHRLLRQPMATMDGINEYGLCFGAFQLPVFASEEYPYGPARVMQEEDGKDYVSTSLLQNLFLNRCKTVKEVESMLRDFNFLALHPSINVHWMVADATGDYAIFEYWENRLYVIRPDERVGILMTTPQIVPYEYNSIENYYVNPEATSTYMDEAWQYGYSSKVRVGHLMDAYASKVQMKFIGGQYKPVMSEMEALECLQAASYAIEIPGDATNWSCVYNPAQKTVLFNMRNDMSEIYKIDFNADFR